MAGWAKAPRQVPVKEGRGHAGSLRRKTSSKRAAKRQATAKQQQQAGLDVVAGGLGTSQSAGDQVVEGDSRLHHRLLVASSSTGASPTNLASVGSSPPGHWGKLFWSRATHVKYEQQQREHQRQQDAMVQRRVDIQVAQDHRLADKLARVFNQCSIKVQQLNTDLAKNTDSFQRCLSSPGRALCRQCSREKD
jgi:hypothetical protein